MAGKGNIKNLTPFKPGHSGNPCGRAGTLPAEIRAERKKNQSALIKLVTKLFTLTEKEANKAANDEPTQLQCAVQGVINSAKKGDFRAFQSLVEIMVGKIPEHDYDGFTEDDIRILNRVKEVFAEESEAPDSLGSGH